MAGDLNRIAAAAVEALLGEDERAANRHDESPRRFGGVGALALGVGLGVAVRAAYRRARNIDLEQVAGSIEDKLKG
jgi:hypothetical protein